MRRIWEEALYWLWCRWFGHERFPVYIQSFDKGADRMDIRVCAGCGRVYPDDVVRFLDQLEKDLEAPA